MPSTPSTLRRAAALAGACLALAPAAASADSLVYLKDGDVWLSQPDGSGAYQVTTDGTPDSPYRSPSQADDGTIATARYDEIIRMTQNGTVLNTIDPPGLTNSVSHHMDGPPIHTAISPDGSRIAYTLSSFECPPGASCGARFATAYTAADHFTAPEATGTTYFRNTSWVTNSRTLQFGGFGSQVNLHDVGAGSAKHWFDDSDTTDPSTDLGDGEANRQGTDFAVVRGYGDSTYVIWYPAPDPRTGTPATPDPWHGLRHRPGGRARRPELVARRQRARHRGRRRHLGQAPGARLHRPADAGRPRRLGARLGPRRRRARPARDAQARHRQAHDRPGRHGRPGRGPRDAARHQAQARQGAALGPQGHAARRAARPPGDHGEARPQGRRPRQRPRRRRRHGDRDAALHQGGQARAARRPHRQARHQRRRRTGHRHAQALGSGRQTWMMSRIERMPSTSPPWTTTRWRKPPFAIASAASSSDQSPSANVARDVR